MLIHSVLFLVNAALADSITARTTATEVVKKKFLNASPAVLLATSVNDLPFKDVVFYHVKNMSSTNQGWFVWVDLNNDAAHIVAPTKSFRSFLGTIDQPLSNVHLAAKDAVSAKKTTFALLHLSGSTQNSVDCVPKSDDIECNVTSKNNGGTEEKSKLLFQADKNKITVE